MEMIKKIVFLAGIILNKSNNNMPYIISAVE